jgi:NADH-quinone oxidoreductase subunit N
VNLIAFFYAFLFLFNVNSKTFIKKISMLKSLFYINSSLSFIFIFIIFSLASLPPFVGFIGKFFVLLIIICAGIKFNYLIAFLILFGGVISVVYYLRLIKIIFVSNNITYIFLKSPDY